MKKILLIASGVIIIGCAFYNNFDDGGKTAWAIIRIFPLFEIILGTGFLIMSGGGAWIFFDED